jgi:hypothetical protein
MFPRNVIPLLYAPFAFSLLTTAALNQERSLHTKGDEKPVFSTDSNTTKYCSWWYDSDGSRNCSDMSKDWGITLADFIRWVRFYLESFSSNIVQ